MSTIYRYELAVTDEQHVSLPSAHTLLSVAPSRGGYHVDLWARVSASHHETKRTFHIFGTGHPLPDTGQTAGDMDFIGTAVMPDGLVWHVFVEPRDQ